MDAHLLIFMQKVRTYKTNLEKLNDCFSATFCWALGHALQKQVYI